MSSLSQKDRVSLCSFTFADGRRCRTPRVRNHLHFCFYHAQKEARATAAQNLGKDLAYFFSGDYLSACDLSTALARLIPAVVRGDVKPRAARTVAYLAQTLLQAIHISEDEYINAFGTDGWRKSIRNSVKYNHDYRRPPAAGPQPQPLSAQPQTQVPQPASTLPSDPPQPAAITSPAPSPKPTPPQPSEISASCHSERSAEPASSSSPASPTPLPLQTPTTSPQASSTANPSAVPKPQPTSPLPQTPVPTNHPTLRASPPNAPSPTASPAPQRPAPTPNRDPYAVHFDHNHRLFIDGKPF